MPPVVSDYWLIRLMPTMQMVCCIGAAICYALAGDWRKTVYWGAAALITASVTF